MRTRIDSTRTSRAASPLRTLYGPPSPRSALLGMQRPQERASRRRATTTIESQHHVDKQRERERERRQSRHQRQRASTAVGHDNHSIHLESAPWLGHERQQAPQTAPFAPVAAPMRPPARREQQLQPEQHATKGSSTQNTQTTSHSTAGSVDSMMTESTRSLLYDKAVQISHALVRRAHQTIKSIERGHCGANRLRGSMDVDGYRFLHMSKGGVAVYEDATSIHLEQRKTPSRPRFIAVLAVKATLDEFVETFGHGSSATGARPLHGDTPSWRQMHTIADEQDRHMSVKWLAMQPTWTGSLARRRDFVVLECEEMFAATRRGARRDTRGWVQMVHSVQLPWCPPLEKVSSIVRGSMYQTGTVVLESEASPEWLHVVSAVELDMKGNMSDRSQRANALRRLASLDAVAPTLVQQRVQRLSLMQTKLFQAMKAPKETHCVMCTQRIGLPSLRRHHYCRKCSASVCGDCSRSCELSSSAKATTTKTKKKKARVCGLCLRSARSSSLVHEIDDVTERILVAAREQHARYEAPTSRASPPIVTRASRPRSSRAPSERLTSSTTPPRVSRYFDLPMDARELETRSSADARGSSSDCNQTICASSDAPVADVSRKITTLRTVALEHKRRAEERSTRGTVRCHARVSRTVVESDEDESEVDAAPVHALPRRQSARRASAAVESRWV